jgi:hypothetical protein
MHDEDKEDAGHTGHNGFAGPAPIDQWIDAFRVTSVRKKEVGILLFRKLCKAFRTDKKRIKKTTSATKDSFPSQPKLKKHSQHLSDQISNTQYMSDVTPLRYTGEMFVENLLPFRVFEIFQKGVK